MPTPTWQPGTLYAPGSLVQPASAIAPVPDQVTNGGFELGNMNWALASGFSIGEFGNGTHFQGTWSLQWDLTGTGRAINDNATEVEPGQTITANCQVQQGASASGDAGARAEIAWYDASDELITFSSGNLVQSGSNQSWKQSTVVGVAPAGAAFARFAVYAFRTTGGAELWVDNCTWDAVVSTLPTGLVFRAVQNEVGYSGATEPVWPVVNGQTVVDNEVTWEAVFSSRVVWEASPVLTSGAYEPTWPTVPNGTVADGTIKWVAMPARVTDPKCPNSKIVEIAASKIFAADDDIIPFSATVNPLDWSSEQDAGYIPFGLNTYGSTPVTAMSLYRGNLIAFNSEGFQMWQVDQDPANMALLDASPVSCLFFKSAQPVMNDLVMCTPQGVRNIGIAGASTNLQAGFFGAQVDPLVLAAIRSGIIPFALFWPGAGQYWLIFGAEAFVLTMNGGNKDQSWSRYVFPRALTYWAILEGDLYLRAGELVWRMDPDALADDVYFDTPAITGLTLPEEPGTLLVWPNAVLFRRSQASGAGVQVPNGYEAVDGVVTIPGGEGYAVIANAGNTGSTAQMVVEITGTDPDGGALSETITKETGTLFAVGSELFGTITGVELISGTGGDGFYVAGYQVFTPDDDATDLTLDLRGAIAIESSANGGSVTARGLFGVDYPVDIPDNAQLTITRKSGTAAKDFLIDGDETISLPVGVVGQSVTSVGFYDTVSSVVASLSGSVTVDVGVILTVEAQSEPFEGYMAWEYLDFGAAGLDKMLDSVDVACTGEVSVSIGWSQRDFSLATDPYTFDGDTLTGTPIPIPVTAPSFQLRLTFSSSQEWEWSAANLYLSP